MDYEGEVVADIALSHRPIRALVTEKDCSALAAVSDAGELFLIDPLAWKFRSVSVCAEKLWSVAFLADLGQIVVGGNSGELHWFDRSTLIRRRISTPHSSWIRTLAYHEQSRTLWSGGEDQRLSATDPVTGQVLVEKIGPSPRIFSIKPNDIGRAHAVGCGDGRLHLVSENERLAISWTASGHMDQISCVAISGSREFVVSGSDDRRVGLWHLDNGNLVGLFETTQAWISSVGIDDETGDILAGDDNGMLHWLDSTSLKRKGAYQLSDRRLSSMCRVETNIWIVSTDGSELIKIDVSPAGLRALHKVELSKVPIFSLAMSVGEIVAGTGDGHIVVLSQAFDLICKKRVSTSPVWCVSATESGLIAFSSDGGEVGIWDRGADALKQLHKQARAVWTCSFLRGQDSILFGGEGGELRSIGLDGSVRDRLKLPLVFTGTNWAGVRGLGIRHRTLIGIGGGRIT